MFTKSIAETAKLLFLDLLWGAGFGAVLSMILVFGFRFPDTFAFVMVVVTPVALVYLVWKIVTKYSSITITDSGVVIKTMLGKTQLFGFDAYEIQPIVTSYRLSYIPFALGISAVVTTKATHKTKQMNIHGYPKNEIERIVTALAAAQA